MSTTAVCAAVAMPRVDAAGKRRAPSPVRVQASAPVTLAGTPGAVSWLDRLAAWADARPGHHRLGRWTLLAR